MRNSAIRLDTPDQLVDQTIAWTKEASQHAVDYVLTRVVGEDDGRSPWFWMRLANGDLALVTFPRGETYMFVSDGGDAEMTYP